MSSKGLDTATNRNQDLILFPEARMTAGGPSAFRSAVPAPDPSGAELAELARLRERFRTHRIFHEVRIGQRVRFLAYRTAPGIQPHTIITDDLAELRDELEQATRTSPLS